MNTIVSYYYITGNYSEYNSITDSRAYYQVEGIAVFNFIHDQINKDICPDNGSLDNKIHRIFPESKQIMIVDGVQYISTMSTNEWFWISPDSFSPYDTFLQFKNTTFSTTGGVCQFKAGLFTLGENLRFNSESGSGHIIDLNYQKIEYIKKPSGLKIVS